ncbi:Toll-like receptor [Mactra antiquata]
MIVDVPVIKLLLHSLLNVILLSFSTAYSDGPCLCMVDMSELSADCKLLGIKNLTKTLECIPNNIKSITFAYNSISDIPDNVFKNFTSLCFLSLDHNNIEYITDNAFDGLAELNELSLVSNHLQHTDSYSMASFKPLSKLRILHIEGNCDVNANNCTYPDEVLSQIHSLEDLSIDGIPYINFGEGFSKLSNLRSILLTSSPNGYCFMPLLNESTFSAFRSTPLSLVTINGCDIYSIFPNAFQSIWNLTKLVIIDNRHLCLNALDNATLGLNHTNIRHIEFTYWCRYPPKALILGDGMLTGLTNTSLESLVFEYDDISYISPDSMNNLPLSLQYISFKENNVNDAHFLSNLFKLDNLLTFDLSYQNHYDADNDVTMTSEDGTNSENGLRGSGMVIKPKPYPNEIRLPKHIRTIYMSYIKLKYPIPPLIFTANDLRYIDASGCLLLAFIGPWFGLESLEIFILSDNLLSYMNPSSFSAMPNLRELYLGGNQIGTSILADTKGRTFSRQTNLEILNLSANGIKDLPYLIFHNLTSLVKLSLARNSLQNFSILISPMSKLEVLDLSDNEIVDISPDDRKALDDIAADHELEIDLSGNTMVCKCDNKDFMNWIAVTNVNIIGKSEMKCVYLNNSLVKLSNIDEIVNQLKYECSLEIVLIACISSFVGFILLLSLVAVIYHKRWQLRYFYYMGRGNLTPYHPLEESEIELDIDAYISYEPHFQLTDDVDLHKYIADVIHPTLTADKLCVKIREELTEGQFLFNTISEAVRKSRKVIVMLTPEYCNDYWNTFEFNMAVYEGIYTKRNIILPIIIGDLSNMNWSHEIHTVVQTKIKTEEYIHIPNSASLVQNIQRIILEIEKKLQF